MHISVSPASRAVSNRPADDVTLFRSLPCVSAGDVMRFTRLSADVADVVTRFHAPRVSHDDVMRNLPEFWFPQV